MQRKGRDISRVLVPPNARFIRILLAAARGLVHFRRIPGISVDASDLDQGVAAVGRLTCRKPRSADPANEVGRSDDTNSRIILAGRRIIGEGSRL